MKTTDTSVLFASPGPGKAAFANAVYTRATGVEKMLLRSYMTRSDTKDWFERSWSNDNGRTWGETREESFIRETPEGVERNNSVPGFADPVRDRYLEFSIFGVLPTDSPLEGMKHWRLRYRVSRDGGRTFTVDEQMIQEGDYDEDHPFEGMYVGKNSMMLGDRTCRPIRSSSGSIVLPVQITPLGPDGEYYNPGGGHTYHDSAFVIGSWRDDDTIAWDLSQRIVQDPERSTRGAVEPTVVEMPDGRMLSVMRGSNDVRPELPGHRWYSVSTDAGHTWSAIAPWRYAETPEPADPFFSPSSCSQLIGHSSGTVYWIGNITPGNPKGNRPRYPLVIGEVDPETLLLRRETLHTVDDRLPGESEDMTLSNFLVDEDRETGELLVFVPRLFTKRQGDWTADTVLHRVAVEE